MCVCVWSFFVVCFWKLELSLNIPLKEKHKQKTLFIGMFECLNKFEMGK